MERLLERISLSKYRERFILKGGMLVSALVGLENRTISIYAYNIETVLAEKLETVISRGTANTRLRDFYDLYILQQEKSVSVDLLKLKMALEATSRKRESLEIMERGASILKQIYNDTDMKKLWINYQKKFDYAKDYTWDEVMESIQNLYDKIQK